eukprot:2528626-Pyramimonas_sp.AAC.2
MSVRCYQRGRGGHGGGGGERDAPEGERGWPHRYRARYGAPVATHRGVPQQRGRGHRPRAHVHPQPLPRARLS